MNPKTFPSFVASGLPVPSLCAVAGDSAPDGPGRVYAGVAWMESHGELWLVTVGNDSRILPLPDAEAMLWEWYRGEYLALPSPEAVAELARPRIVPGNPVSPYVEALGAFHELTGFMPSWMEDSGMDPEQGYKIVEAAEAILAR